MEPLPYSKLLSNCDFANYSTEHRNDIIVRTALLDETRGPTILPVTVNAQVLLDS